MAIIQWIMNIVTELPTVEAKPIVRGEWTVHKDADDVEFIACSFCGGVFYDGDNDTFDIPYHFCPDCGGEMYYADMRGLKNG